MGVVVREHLGPQWLGTAELEWKNSEKIKVPFRKTQDRKTYSGIINSVTLSTRAARKLPAMFFSIQGERGLELTLPHPHGYCGPAVTCFAEEHRKCIHPATSLIKVLHIE